jgi:hypothetical protein
VTHAELVKIAERWLLGTRKCAFAFTELACIATSEIPDAIGFRGDGTILVECKTSRADFLSDKKKYFRRRPEEGVGVYRFFMAPEGIIKPEDLPKGWGLVTVNEKKKPRQIVGARWNCCLKDTEFRNEHNLRAEHGMMMSALRRLHIHNVLHLVKPENNPFTTKAEDPQGNHSAATA